MTFREELQKQRWDDHRYYHHNRINQFLHLLSASCFLISYALVFLSGGSGSCWLATGHDTAPDRSFLL